VPVGATAPQPDRRGLLSTVRALERALDAATADELPAVMGELERLKAVALVRLLGALAGPQHEPGPDPLDLLDVPAVAALLKLDRSTVYDHIRRGRLPVVTLGRAFRVRRADLERFLEERGEDRQPRPAVLPS
jgi:excisionase family DNA binding protein